MQRPSVLFINRVYPPARGASGRVLRDLALEMVRDGWDVHVLTTGLQNQVVRDEGVTVIQVKASEKPRGLFGYWKIWRGLYKAGLKIQPVHLVVSMTDPPLLASAGDRIARKMGAKHIHWCQDLYPDLLPALGMALPKPFMAYFETRSEKAMRSADKVVVIGRCMAKRLTRKGVLPRQISFVPNWPNGELVGVEDSADVQNGLYHPGGVENARRHEEQVKSFPRFRILYAGSLGLAHPLGTILEAAEILQNQTPDVEFVFVGDGDRFERLAQERTRRHLNNIRLMPYQPLTQLRTMMESGDVHLISVQEEAAGMLVPSKLYSALAVGRPSIFLGPAQSEAAKVLRDYEAGCVVAQGDVQGLVDAVVQYRMNADQWFQAHEGAVEAGQVFVPKESMKAWIERAWTVVEQDLRAV